MENSKEKALVIEDEPSIARLCRKVLEIEGFSVDIADNGKDAETLINQSDYKLILMDIRLPVLSGIHVYNWLLKEHPETAENVIFMTGSIAGGDSMKLLHNAGRPYLLKPFRPEELKQVIGNFLVNRQQP